MKPEDFEQQLQRQPLRRIPGDWRECLLDEARQAATTATAPATEEPGAKPARLTWLRAWLWPCPQAWAALAGIWMLILGLKLGMSESASPVLAQAQPMPLTPEIKMALREQRRWQMEMTGRLDLGSMPVSPAQRPRTEKEAGTGAA